MYLYQDNTKALDKISALMFSSSLDYYITTYKQTHYAHMYKFHFSQKGLRRLITMDYTQEVECFLTEINYLGI